MSALDSNARGFGGITREEGDRLTAEGNAKKDRAIRENDVDWFLRRAAHFSDQTSALIALALVLRERNPHA